MKQAFFVIAFLSVLGVSGQVSKSFFGTHIGGPLENNLAGQRVNTLWPTTNPTSVRIWNTWGYNPNKQKYDYLFWRNINTGNGVYDWGLFDKVIDSFKARNVSEMVYAIGYTPAWAGGNAEGTNAPSDTALLSKFVRALAARAIARGWPIRNWEIWNEPNGSAHWTGTAAEMVPLAKAVYQAVKAVDPSYKVVSPSPQGSGADYWMGQYLQAGGGQWCDAIAFHGYINFYQTDALQATQEKFEQLIYKIRNLMTKYNVGTKELWDTEGFDLFTCGGTCYDYPSQAAYLAQRFLVSAARGLSRVFWYAWDQNHGKQWGNETGSFQVNEVGLANEKIMTWMQGATVDNLVVASGVYTVDVTRNGVTSKAVWTNSGTLSYATTYMQYETLGGTTGTVSGGTVSISRKPILLKGTNTVALIPPSVSLTSPLANTSVTAPASVSVSAAASDADGAVTKVEFYSNGTLIGTATAAPYTVVWGNVAAGNYSLTAKATDNNGLSATSQAVSMTVKALIPPSVSLTSPLANTSVTAPASVSVSAAASDADGAVTKVEFYSNGTLIGTATAAPYTVVWGNVAAGNYSLTAKATDNNGLSATSQAVSMTVKALIPPSVSLTSPLANTSVTAPASVSVSAAASDADGAVTKVEFYSNGTLIGTATAAPYTVVWGNVAAGNYSLTAKATDNNGLSATSQAVSMTVSEVPTSPFYKDADGDGYGNSAEQVLAVAAPAGYTAKNGDCNDADPLVHPGAVENCGNGIDDNCNGQIDENCTISNGGLATKSDVSINDTSVTVFSAYAVLTVRLSAASIKDVAVSYKTVNGTAKNNLNFVSAQGVLTIPAGQLSGEIKIQLLNTTSITKTTNSRYFFVQLASPINSSLTDSSGKVTITYKKQLALRLSKAGYQVRSEEQISNSISDEIRTTAYPNPSGNFFNLQVEGGSADAISLNVIDLTGRVVERYTGISPNSKIRVGQNLKRGLYLVQAVQGSKTAETKIVKL